MLVRYISLVTSLSSITGGRMLARPVLALPVLALHVLVIILFLTLYPLPAYAQQASIFTVRANQTVNVHRGPSVDQPIVGTLAAGMEARIFSCISGCLWLEMGPNVWIASTGVTGPPDVVLPTTQTVQPIPVVPTPIPVSGISVEEQEYINFFSGQSELYSLSSEELAAQLLLVQQNPSLVFSPEWQSQIAAAIPIIEAANTTIRNRTPPARFVPVHNELVSAANNYEQAVRLMREAIDTRDVNKFLQSLSYFQEGNAATQRSRAAFDALNLTSAAIPYSQSGVVIQPTPTPQAVAIQGCDPNYTGVCIPIGIYDLDCADVNARGFASVGYDPHNLDGNDNGVACEE